MVKNEGNVGEDVGLRIKDQDSWDEWTAGTPAQNVYELSCHLAATAGTFDANDVLTTAVQWCDGATFGGGGYDMPPLATVNQWFRLRAPTSVSGAHAEDEHIVTVEISCQQTP